MKALKITAIVFLLVIIALSASLWFSRNEENNLAIQNTKLQRQNENLKNQIEDLQNQTIQLKNQNSLLNNQTIDLQNKISTYPVRINHLENQTMTLEKNNTELRSQIIQLQNEINELRNPSYKAIVTSVTNDEWWNPGGIALTSKYYITIKNLGAKDVEGLTIGYKVLGNTTNYLPLGVDYVEQPKGILHVNETKQITMTLWTNLAVTSEVMKYYVVVTIKLGDSVLDEHSFQVGSPA